MANSHHTEAVSRTAALVVAIAMNVVVSAVPSKTIAEDSDERWQLDFGFRVEGYALWPSGPGVSALADIYVGRFVMLFVGASLLHDETIFQGLEAPSTEPLLGPVFGLRLHLYADNSLFIQASSRPALNLTGMCKGESGTIEESDAVSQGVGGGCGLRYTFESLPVLAETWGEAGVVLEPEWGNCTPPDSWADDTEVYWGGGIAVGYSPR